MKYKVLINFTDKYNGYKYKIGEIKTFDEKRANEILAKGKLIEKLVEEPEDKFQTDEEIEYKNKNKNKNYK